MTTPLSIVSGIALGMSLATPRLGIADPVNAPPTEQTLAQPPVNAPTVTLADSNGVQPTPRTFAQAIDDALRRRAAEAAAAQPATQTSGETVANATGATAVDSNDTPPPTTRAEAFANEPAATFADSEGTQPTITGQPSVNAPPLTLGASDAAQPSTSTPTLGQELLDGFYSRIYLIGYGIVQDPVNSGLNPDNALAIPRYQTELNFRPDFDLNFRQFEFGIKPRFTTSWSRVQNGVDANTDTTTATAYINEWIARYRVTNQLLVSYGRENLQWGPSQLLSPSNPFNQNNGKNNPAIEQPGQDYGRVVVIPNSSWTLSLIANTGVGRLEDSGEETGPFHKAYAAKLDYTADRGYFSVIASKRETTPYRIGYFGGWTVSDALLTYSEGSVAVSHNSSTPRTDYDILVGAAYTLAAGPTITVEYFHHNIGCNGSQIDRCVSPANLDPTNPLPRRDYVLLQYVDTKIFHNLNLTVRVIQDINDHSTELVSDLEYEVGENWQLYLVPSVTRGPSSSEFGSLLRYSVFAGVAFTF
ncbi:hypothetical protein [Paraburkholderia sp. GAS348]|uniref:hypothetical protein n=1 Tax=Paraburkholderia sp. GAS348 TaxID=3035132 RepID=UPI003D1CEE26